MLPAELAPLLHDLRARLDALYGERLARLILFGSHARGEAREDSDVDVLVVLRGAVDHLQEIERMGEARFAGLTEHGRSVALIPVSEEGYRHHASPLLVNARAEGVLL